MNIVRKFLKYQRFSNEIIHEAERDRWRRNEKKKIEEEISKTGANYVEPL